jgi:hypothetical protein
MRDAIVARQKQLDRELARAVQLAIDTGDLAPDTDPRQLAFDMLGIVLVFGRSELLLGAEEATERARKAFDSLLRAHQTPR